MAEADHILADAELRARMGAAVMTLARWRATTRVKEQFRAQGLKVAHMSHREIVVAAEESEQPARACGAGTLAVQMSCTKWKGKGR